MVVQSQNGVMAYKPGAEVEGAGVDAGDIVSPFIIDPAMAPDTNM